MLADPRGPVNDAGPATTARRAASPGAARAPCYDGRVTRVPSPGGPTTRCPHCGAPVSWPGNPQRPFCSLGCRLLDLGAWLDERYRVPGPDVTAEAGPGEERADRG